MTTSGYWTNGAVDPKTNTVGTGGAAGTNAGGGGSAGSNGTAGQSKEVDLSTY